MIAESPEDIIQPNGNALSSVMIAEPSEDIIQPKLCRHAHFLDSGNESVSYHEPR